MAPCPQLLPGPRRLLSIRHHTYIPASLEQQGQGMHASPQSLLKSACNTSSELTGPSPAPREDGNTAFILSGYVSSQKSELYFCGRRENGYWAKLALSVMETYGLDPDNMDSLYLFNKYLLTVYRVRRHQENREKTDTVRSLRRLPT